MSNFRGLLVRHQELLLRRESGVVADELVQAARDYIEEIKQASSEISSPRRRQQLRANLRFWASYVFDETGTYPDTSLRPATPGPPSEPVTQISDVSPPDFDEIPQFVRSAVEEATTRASGIRIPTGGTLPEAPRARRWLPSPPVSSTGRGGWTGWVVVGVIVVGALLAGVVLGLRSAFGITTDTPTVAPAESTRAVQTPAGEPEETIAPTEVAVAAATATPAAVAVISTPSPALTATPFPSVLPDAGGGGGYVRPQLLATVSAGQHPQGCAARTLAVDFDLADLFEQDALQSAALQLIRAGDEEAAVLERLDPFTESVAFELAQFGADNDDAYLLSVYEPGITAASVILQFDADCSRNLVEVSYAAADEYSMLEEQPPADGDLALDWRLLAWGPSPYGMEWVAALQLQGRGGDGRYFYWVDGVVLPDDQLVMSGFACEAARATVGVTSGGQAVLRELVLQAPHCP